MTREQAIIWNETAECCSDCDIPDCPYIHAVVLPPVEDTKED